MQWSTVEPTHDQYFFIPQDKTLKGEYQLNFPLPSAMIVNGAGYITARDNLVVDFDKKNLENRITAFKNSNLTNTELLEDFQISAKDGWDLSSARQALKSIVVSKSIHQTFYRPFDWRWIFFDPTLIWGRSWPTHKHMVWGTESRALISTRLTKDKWDISVANAYASHKCVSAYDTGNIFPLWLEQGGERQANFSANFLSALIFALTLTPTDYRPEDPAAPLHAEKIFHYIYAVLHSPAYRQRYAAFLRTDFPRIPIPGSRALFDALAQLGSQLVQWHLLEHPDAAKMIAYSACPASATAFFGTDFSLQKVAEKGKALAELSGDVGKVFINASSGFANVRQGVWQHTIGGYQVLHKWLDDRRKAGRTLSPDDITHWLRVYAALEATQTLMQQVDTAIDAHGGWPGTAGASSGSAFSQNHPPPDAATLAAEQMAQREQTKAQKKAAAATKKKAAYASPTGANSLFDFDDDLDALAEASGAPPRPKVKATPAKAAGGQAAATASKADDITDAQAMCALRAVLAQSGPLARADLIRQTARRLGCVRTTKAMAGVLDNAIRRAVGRGIAQNHGGLLSLWFSKVEDYDREFLKQQLLRVIPASGVDKAQLPVRFARHLGFARVGPVIESTVWSLVRSLQRADQVQLEGRGNAARYRRA